MGEKNKNYWLLTTEYPPLHGGGISTYAHFTAQMLSENGFNVKVFVYDYDTNQTKRESVDGIELIRFNLKDEAFNQSLGFEAAVSFAFAEIIEKEINDFDKPDFIESQDYQGIAYYLLQRKMLLEDCFQNIPIILTLHAPSFLYLDYNQSPLFEFPQYWVGEMEKACIKAADILISPSKFLVDKLKCFDELKNINCEIIHNPYPTELLKENSEPKFNRNEIVFFGKLTPQKGCLEMMQYFKKLWDNGFEHKLRIIGGGNHYFYPLQMDMIEYFKKKYSKYFKNGKIIFEGNQKPEIALKKLQNAHIVLVPSIVDNFPYVVLEAMSLGKIVLGSTDSGHTEIIEDGVNSFLFEHKKENDFQNKLQQILNLEDNQIEIIGRKAAETVAAKTNFQTIANQKIEFINSFKNLKRSEFSFIHDLEKQKSENKAKKPGLTVLIPHYNLGEFIEECVQSVLNSDLKADRIIIVDDGSSDEKSLNILKKIESKFDIEIIYNENQGLPLSRNFAASLVETEFMAFLDADDTIDKTYYSKAIKVLSEYENVSFVGCWANYFGENNQIWPAFNPEPPYILVHNSINSSALIYKTNDFLASGLNKKKMLYGMEDYESVISMTEKGFRGVVIPQPLWNYRIRGNSMAHSFNYFSKQYLYRLISAEHKEFYAKFAADIVNLLNANGVGFTYDNPTWKVIKANEINLPFLNSKLVRKIKRNKILRKIGKKVYNRINK